MRHVNVTARLATMAGALMMIAAMPVFAQHAGHAQTTQAQSADSAMQGMADRQMTGHMMDGPHVRMTPERVATPADSARAAAIVTTLRESIAKYKDVKVAEADGYKMFAPEIKNQPVYHFTNYGRAFMNAFRFDPSKPTSLLYRKAPDGSMRLAGAMYTAPARASLEQLDKRVPLGVARWHLHTNWCLPPRGEKEKWTETKNGKPVFGPEGVATREECEAAGGTFHPSLFGWMVHANVYESDDPKVIWGGEHHGDQHGAHE